jgi:hypothetical protein
MIVLQREGLTAGRILSDAPLDLVEDDGVLAV